VKNSFTLFETLLALTVISILIGGFLKTSYTSSSTDLDLIQNALILNDSPNIKSSSFDLSYEHTSELHVKILKQGSYHRSTYETSKILLEKLHIATHEKNLNFKVFP